MSHAPDGLFATIERKLAGATQRTVRRAGAELRVQRAGARWPIVIVEHRTDVDHAAVLLARICDERAASPTTMLRIAAKIGAGAIALVGSSYVVRFTIPASQLGATDLEPMCTYVERLATELAAIVAGPAQTDGAVFDHYSA